jgi:hypothetical protein
MDGSLQERRSRILLKDISFKRFSVTKLKCLRASRSTLNRFESISLSRGCIELNSRILVKNR